jgi:hypothetical protein
MHRVILITLVGYHGSPVYVSIFFLYMFLANQRFIFVIFSSVAPHRRQPAAKYHPRWQPTRRLSVSCGLGRRQIRTRDCRTTVWHATTEPPPFPNWATTLPYWATTLPWLSPHASLLSHHASLCTYLLIGSIIEGTCSFLNIFSLAKQSKQNGTLEETNDLWHFS